VCVLDVNQSKSTVSPSPNAGGQYRPAIGLSTLDGRTDAEWEEDHRRRLADFEAELKQYDPDGADCEPY
jgi:hypothetical protein